MCNRPERFCCVRPIPAFCSVHTQRPFSCIALLLPHPVHGDRIRHHGDRIRYKRHSRTTGSRGVCVHDSLKRDAPCLSHNTEDMSALPCECPFSQDRTAHTPSALSTRDTTAFHTFPVSQSATVQNLRRKSPCRKVPTSTSFCAFPRLAGLGRCEGSPPLPTGIAATECFVVVHTRTMGL